MVSGGSHFRYSDEVRNLVLLQLAGGVRPTDIANALGVSRPFISQVKARGAVDPDLLKRSQLPKGRPPKIPPHAVEGLKDFVQKYPEAERAEIRDFLKEQFGVEVHLSTIGRFMQKLNQTGPYGDDSNDASKSLTIAARTSASRPVHHITKETSATPTRKHRKRKAK